MRKHVCTCILLAAIVLASGSATAQVYRVIKGHLYDLSGISLASPANPYFLKGTVLSVADHDSLIMRRNTGKLVMKVTDDPWFFNVDDQLAYAALKQRAAKDPAITTGELMSMPRSSRQFFTVHPETTDLVLWHYPGQATRGMQITAIAVPMKTEPGLTAVWDCGEIPTSLTNFTAVTRMFTNAVVTDSLTRTR
jgi:hypothetical protein